MQCRWLKKQMSFYYDLAKRRGNVLHLAFGWEWIVVIVVVVLVFGVGKLAHVGGALGKSIREFRKEKDKIDDTRQLNTRDAKEEKSTQTEVEPEDESSD